VKPALTLALGGPLLFLVFGCGAAAPAAPAPSVSAATTTTVTISSLTGTWTGMGTDAQGAETFRWTVTQTGNQITGTAVMNSANPTDGSCGSCHKQKNGTVSGTLSGGALTLALDFPSGGTDITPLCGLTMNATTSDMASGRIAAAYTGTTTCEGAITDGSLVVVR